MKSSLCQTELWPLCQREMRSIRPFILSVPKVLLIRHCHVFFVVEKLFSYSQQALEGIPAVQRAEQHSPASYPRQEKCSVP